MLTPREKSPLPENVPRGGSNPLCCGQRAQALPTELFRPPKEALKVVNTRVKCVVICLKIEKTLYLLQYNKIAILYLQWNDTF